MTFFKRVSVAAILSVLMIGTATASFIKDNSVYAEPDKSIAHQEKGNLLDEQGRSVEALEEYKEALIFDPDDTNTLFNMGTVYLKMNKPQQAVTIFESLIKIDSRDTESYNLLGLAYRGCGKKKEAIDVWLKSLAIDPTQTMPRKFIEEAKAL
jgi:tetratricopeptide (TPR) repeat protein